MGQNKETEDTHDPFPRMEDLKNSKESKDKLLKASLPLELISDSSNLIPILSLGNL